MSLAMLGGVVMSPVSLAIAGLLVDVGLATEMFVAGGILIGVATVAGILWGVPAQMREVDAPA
jgi:hypothetical protein